MWTVERQKNRFTIFRILRAMVSEYIVVKIRDVTSYLNLFVYEIEVSFFSTMQK